MTLSVVHEADPADYGGTLTCLRCRKSSMAISIGDQWSYVPEYVTCPGVKVEETGPGGVWLAFFYDRSAAVPFATEIEALRYAIDMQMQVKFAEFGDSDWMSH